MNIEIKVSKLSIDNDPKLYVIFGETTFEQNIIFLNQSLYLMDIDHKKDTKLIVGRYDPDLYFTRYNHHVNKVTIDKVIIDDFWTIEKDFYPPKSTLDIAYKNHVNKVGEGEWILDSLKYNTTLFFNGSLQWDIKYPVRRSFFKDINR